MFLNGNGNLFLGLGNNAPSEDFVIHAMLTLTSTDLSQFEMCSVLGRVTRDNSRNAQTMIEFGITNSGAAVVIDRTDPATQAMVAVADLGLTLGEPHHLLAIGNSATVDVFVDGDQALSSLFASVRSGTYGLSLIGRAATSPRCEGEDFWVFTF
jgi:hypothetical protein